MKLTMLGTGNAGVLKIFNTCFLMDDDHQLILVDTGGGNRILSQIKAAGYRVPDIHHIIISHRHSDHITGIIWLLRQSYRALAKEGSEDLYIYSHDEVIDIVRDFAYKLFPENREITDRKIHFVEVHDNETLRIFNRDVTFFDIHSQKAKQFGFCMKLKQNRKLTFLGDEPFNEYNRQYVENAAWLMHEAFCLYAEKDIFQPYKKQHSTALDACKTAEKYHVRNTILYHTEESHENRKELYLKEGKSVYQGNLFVPDDNEVIQIED